MEAAAIAAKEYKAKEKALAVEVKKTRKRMIEEEKRMMRDELSAIETLAKQKAEEVARKAAEKANEEEEAEEVDKTKAKALGKATRKTGKATGKTGGKA